MEGSAGLTPFRHQPLKTVGISIGSTHGGIGDSIINTEVGRGGVFCKVPILITGLATFVFVAVIIKSGEGK